MPETSHKQHDTDVSGIASLTSIGSQTLACFCSGTIPHIKCVCFVEYVYFKYSYVKKD